MKRFGAALAALGIMGITSGVAGLPVLTASAGAQTTVKFGAEPMPPRAEAIASDKIKDLTAMMVVEETDRDALAKMGGSFGKSLQYSIKRMNVTYQYPNKARFEGKILGATLLMVYNGDRKMFKTPIKSESKDIHGQPGQKQTLMDLGIFARDYLTTDYMPVFVRAENGLQVFKLSQRFTDNTSHEIVWVNPKTSIIEKRLSYNGDNILQKELRFKNPVQVRPGIFLPSRLEIYNTAGEMAAAQAIRDVKVNLGVDENMFRI
ncbi:MAG: hypothetical protein NW241_07775 [Bacteroidia bacterium]|nr:hypothetical protein [Bacteroidia bacterium]